MTQKAPFSNLIREIFKKHGWKNNQLAPGISSSIVQKVCRQNFLPAQRNLGKWQKVLEKEGEIVELKKLHALWIEQSSNALPTLARRAASQFAGVYRATIGSSRIDAFRNLTGKAQHRVIIMGIGMSNLARYAKQTLSKIATEVPLDLLMLDPKVLHDDPAFARRVEEFLDIPDFRSNAQQSFDILKGFCSAWNSKASVKHKVRFRVYVTIPTMSMVLIDADTNI